MKDSNDIHIIRWDEIPDFPLYVDQVIKLIDDSLDFLKLEEDKKVITNTMINNYIKHGIIEGPKKKKYIRIHVAYLISVTLLKQVYSMDEIMLLLQVANKNTKPDILFNSFCDTFEAYMSDISTNTITNDYSSKRLENILNKVIKAIVYKIYTEQELNQLAEKK